MDRPTSTVESASEPELLGLQREVAGLTVMLDVKSLGLAAAKLPSKVGAQWP